MFSSSSDKHDCDKIVVVGASGMIGRATIDALSGKVGCGNVTVVTRNPTTRVASSFKSAGCRVVQGTMASAATLVEPMRGASAVFLVTPGAENRADLVRNGLEAARIAGVPFVLVLSTPTATLTRTVFGRQFFAIEKAAQTCGVPCAILRLPMFTDDFLRDKETVRTQAKFYGVLDPDAKHSTVAVCDAGEAAATVLCNPSAHKYRTYTICGPAWSNHDAEKALSSALNKDIRYQQVTYDSLERVYAQRGWERWAIAGVMECFRLTEQGRYEFREGDFCKLTGNSPTSLQCFIDNHKNAFMGTSKMSIPLLKAAGKGSSTKTEAEMHAEAVAQMHAGASMELAPVPVQPRSRAPASFGIPPPVIVSGGQAPTDQQAAPAMPEVDQNSKPFSGVLGSGKRDKTQQQAQAQEQTASPPTVA